MDSHNERTVYVILKVTLEANKPITDSDVDYVIDECDYDLSFSSDEEVDAKVLETELVEHMNEWPGTFYSMADALYRPGRV